MTDTELSPVQKRQLEAFRMPSPEEIKRVTNYALWEGFLEKQQALKSAAAVPLPGASNEALPVRSEQFQTFWVRPAKAGDWCNLQHLESPILEQIIEASKPEATRKTVSIGFLDKMVAIYCFTRPSKHVYDLIAKEGPQKVKDEAFVMMQDIPVEMLGDMFEAAQGQIAKPFNVAIQYGGEGEKKSTSQDTSQHRMATDGSLT